MWIDERADVAPPSEDDETVEKTANGADAAQDEQRA